MANYASKNNNMNFLPYIICTNIKTNEQLNLLLDTGANKNVLRPGILQKTQPTNKTTIKNISGSYVIDRKGEINLLGHNLPKQTFYEIKFHDFFDGIIGSEFLAKTKASIDYETCTITMNGLKLNFQKFFPAAKLFHHTITIDTTIDGDWIVPTLQKLNNKIIVKPGLYSAQNNKSTIHVLTPLKEIKSKIPKIALNVNNFETITPIPLNSEEDLDLNMIEKLIRTEHLSKLEKKELLSTILQHQHVLLKEDEKLTATMAIKHQIITKDDEPVYTKSYRYPHHFKKDVEDQIRDMLDNGIIQHSTSPYSSPIWVVPKKSDASGKRKIRVVIDYRKLNEKTVNDKFPIPQIEEILDSLGKSEYFTTLDLKSGFHQIQMDPKHQAKTAFSTAQGHFEFVRMPFGLKNAPATFQRAMNYILADYIGTICYVYLDDIIIIGYNLKNHLENITKVLKRLSDFNLKIQLDKCEFLKKETEFLGHVITPLGIKPDPSKINKILDWKLPTSQKEIKQFLGLTGYYRRFIKDYAKLAKPLSKYLKKDIVIDLNDKEYKIGFEKLKLILTSDQILSYPDFDLPFILTTDASNFALGAVLSQIQDNIEKPIAFGSRTLNKAEENYSTTEKEALAIIWAVEKYRPYLFGNKFTLITDHKPLTFIKSSVKNQKILRWRLELESFDYDVQYKEGKTNVVADALSRKIEHETTPIINHSETSEDNDNFSQQNNPPSEMQDEENDTTDSDTVHSANTSDDHYIHCTERPINYYHNQIIFRVCNFESEMTETPFPNYHRATICKINYDEEAILSVLKRFHNNKQSAIMAPESLMGLIQEVYKKHFEKTGHFVLTQNRVADINIEAFQNALISKEHERAHRGITENENQLKRSYFFPGMHAKIKKFVNTCTICNAHKYDRRPYNIKISPRPRTERPMDRIHMDIFSIDRHNFLSLVDAFSKHAQLIPMDTKNLIDVKNALTQYFAIFGSPREIITDHETTFRSIQLRNFLDSVGTCLKYASSSESNGQVEKTHSTLIETLNANKHKFPNSDIVQLIQLTVSFYNSSVHSSTGFTPNEVLFNQENNVIRQDIDETARVIFTKVKANLDKAAARQLNQNKHKEEPPELQENQQVFIKPNIRKKLEARAKQNITKQVTERTFQNNKNVKRHKNKIKRLKAT